MAAGEPWSRLSDEPLGEQQDFALTQVKRLDVDAVRPCGRFEYRYHAGGCVTWYAEATQKEEDFTEFGHLPTRGWRHLPGCRCRECRRADAGGATGTNDPRV